MEIVVEKDRVVRAGSQQTLRFGDVVRDIHDVAFEVTRKPTMPSRIVVKQENSDWMALGSHLADAELGE
jgi:hypothetical protein